MGAPDANAFRAARRSISGGCCATSCAISRPSLRCWSLIGFFSIAAPAFATLGNLENILQQVSITAIIAVGLTFVVLTAEIDLSVARDGERDGDRADLFTMQPDYVNIANFPLPGGGHWARAVGLRGLGLITAFGVTKIGIPPSS